jgi:hypothetical protein
MNGVWLGDGDCVWHLVLGDFWGGVNHADAIVVIAAVHRAWRLVESLNGVDVLNKIHVRVNLALPYDILV